MSESTPGPWRLDEEQREVLALKVKRICEVPGGGIVSTGVDKANARLIAAAPDLLTGCEMARDAYNAGPDPQVVRFALDGAIDYLRAAIGSALGEVAS